MHWHIELKFCLWLCFTVLQIKFECHQPASIFVGVVPLLELKILEIHSFPHFSLTCFDILSWNFTYDFVLLYYRSSLSVTNLRQFLWELCPFWNLKYWEYTVFRTFLLYALTYWAEILHMTLFYCTTDQVRVSLICINFCRSNAPFETLSLGVQTFLCYPLTKSKWKFVASFDFYSYRSNSLSSRYTNFFNELQIWICWIGGDLYCFSNTLSMLVYTKLLCMHDAMTYNIIMHAWRNDVWLYYITAQ